MRERTVFSFHVKFSTVHSSISYKKNLEYLISLELRAYSVAAHGRDDYPSAV